jgi:enoyl-CoA hydratase/carnithine racemase
MTLCVSVVKKQGISIGRLCLDRPNALNALSLELIQALQRTLDSWKLNSDIDLIVLESSHPKAFCVGGDVKEVALQKSDSQTLREDFVHSYFKQEYVLDLSIHTYPKPIICWGDGYILGGGMGLFQGACFRVACPKSILAMPEVSIGLFPDVGAGWFLNQLPLSITLFLGLTGARLNCTDALDLGLADFILSAEVKEVMISELLKLPLHDKTDLKPAVEDILHALALTAQTLPNGSILPIWQAINSLVNKYNLLATIKQLQDSFLNQQNSFFNTCITTLLQGSPLSAVITWEHLHKTRSFSLKECFDQDLKSTIFCFTQGDFCEGVRGALVEKQKPPQWKHSWNDDLTALQSKVRSTLL